MTQRLVTPEIEDLPAMIRSACDALPGPDEDRLAALQTRLDSQLKKRPRRPRRTNWLLWLLLLAGGTVAAAWWVGERMTGESAAQVSEQDLPSINKSEQPAEGIGRAGAKATHNGEQRSPVIYKREAN